MTSPVRTKICGIQSVDDAVVSAEAGADYIGLVFVPERRRRLDVEDARQIYAGLHISAAQPPEVVGLFADQPLDEVVHTIGHCNLELAQLCGKESPEYSFEVMQATGAAVIKVVHVAANEGVGEGQDGPGLATRIAGFQAVGCRITLDRLVEGLQGGTGQSFNWEVAAQLSGNGHRFLLAGGLTPDNVAAAVSQVHPWGVDVSSGVETGGKKDAEKIRAFIENARRASEEPRNNVLPVNEGSHHL